MNILEELYNGNIVPDEKRMTPDGEYSRLTGELSKMIDKFKPMLDETGAELLDNIIETKNEMDALCDRESFIDGFCLGARIMIEVFSNDITDPNLQ